MKVFSAYLVTTALVLSTGCQSLPPVRTAAENTHEEALRRVVLPGVNEFDGRLVNPVELFRWVEREARAHDQAPDKVAFVITISPTDIPSASDGNVQRSFHYKETKGDDRMVLPDAIKFYASITGLGYRFEKNRVVVYSIKP